MSYPRYPKYKNSGVEWLGEVPHSWTIKRLRRVVQMNPSKGEVANLDDDTMASFFPMEAISEDGKVNLTQRRRLGDVRNGYTYLRDGDVAFAKITPCFENGKGALFRGLENGIGFGTTELTVLRPLASEILPEFLNLMLTSAFFRQPGESFMYGAGGQKRVPDEYVREFRAALPSLEEQRSIVAFLEAEKARIEALIIEQQRLIELLKEKRQAVISHAVTKGLNPDAARKPSGVEWLGDMPAEWNVVRLKFLVSPYDGIQMGPFGGMLLDLEPEDTGFKVYGQENTISGDFSSGSRWIARERYEELRNYRLAPGDLVLTRKGSLGNARLIATLPQPGIADSDTIRVRVAKHLILPEFLTLLLHTAGYIAEQFALMKRGAILPGLNSGTIANLLIVLPSPDEQAHLMDSVSATVAMVDEQIGYCQHAIALLQERRTALISAAVTGKINVRHLGTESAA